VSNGIDHCAVGRPSVRHLLACKPLRPAGRRVLPRLLPPVDGQVDQPVAVVHRLDAAPRRPVSLEDLCSLSQVANDVRHAYPASHQEGARLRLQTRGQRSLTHAKRLRGAKKQNKQPDGSADFGEGMAIRRSQERGRSHSSKVPSQPTSRTSGEVSNGDAMATTTLIFQKVPHFAFGYTITHPELGWHA
jgi:hypothetical protein